MKRTQLLEAFRDECLTRAPTIGQDDCWPWVAAWVKAATGIEIAVPRYDTRDEGYGIAGRHGGPVALATQLMAQAGFEPVHLLTNVGDIGVDRRFNRDVPFIYTDNGIGMFRREGPGVSFKRLRHIVMAWALP